MSRERLMPFPHASWTKLWPTLAFEGKRPTAPTSWRLSLTGLQLKLIYRGRHWHRAQAWSPLESNSG